MNELDYSYNQQKSRVDCPGDYSRRRNTRIKGIEEPARAAMTQEKVQRLLRDALLVGETQLERKPRLENPNRRGGQTRPRVITARFSRFTDRGRALHYPPELENTSIFISE